VVSFSCLALSLLLVVEVVELQLGCTEEMNQSASFQENKCFEYYFLRKNQELSKSFDLSYSYWV